MTSVVMTGRLMNSVVKFMMRQLWRQTPAAGVSRRPPATSRARRTAASRERAAEPRLQLVEVRVEHRRHVQRDDLRECQAAHDRDAERTARRRARADADGDRQRADDRRRPSSS